MWVIDWLPPSGPGLTKQGSRRGQGLHLLQEQGQGQEVQEVQGVQKQGQHQDGPDKEWSLTPLVRGAWGGGRGVQGSLYL